MYLLHTHLYTETFHSDFLFETFFNPEQKKKKTKNKNLLIHNLYRIILHSTLHNILNYKLFCQAASILFFLAFNEPYLFIPSKKTSTSFIRQPYKEMLQRAQL